MANEQVAQASTVRAVDFSRAIYALRVGAPLVALGVLGAVHYYVPSWQLIASTRFTVVVGATAILYLALLIVGVWVPKVRTWVEYYAPVITLGILTILVWDLLTSKSKTLPAPFFPTVDKIVEAFVKDWKLLGESVFYSMRLLVVGYVLGAVAGFATGVFMGWSQRGNYWLTPMLRFIGPIPATAWIPIAMVVFPTSFWASVFLIALSVWFPVAVMTSSGVANVPKSYFEVARSLGADEKYLVRHVAVPSAAPIVFIGLFMGLGMSFLTLIVAEMLGVEAGLGWYISWAKGWAQFGKVYASLIVIAILFSLIIGGLFKVRDRLLAWQKGTVRW